MASLRCWRQFVTTFLKMRCRFHSPLRPRNTTSTGCQLPLNPGGPTWKKRGGPCPKMSILSISSACSQPSIQISGALVLISQGPLLAQTTSRHTGTEYRGTLGRPSFQTRILAPALEIAPESKKRGERKRLFVRTPDPSRDLRDKHHSIRAMRHLSERAGDTMESRL